MTTTEECGYESECRARDRSGECPRGKKMTYSHTLKGGVSKKTR